MSEQSDSEGWSTRPQETRERTCEHSGGPFSVRHCFCVARRPDPTTTTVVRSYEVSVEWTAQDDLPEWLSAVAGVCTPYGDRFGTPCEPDDDGRFLASPVDATVRPPESGPAPGCSDPYHYWNTPLSRLKRDDHYPDRVTSVTLGVVDGPRAVWTAESTAGVVPADLPGDEGREDYTRVGLEFATRERIRRPTEDGASVPGVPTPDAEDDVEGWHRHREADAPVTDDLSPAIEETLAPAVREYAADIGGIDDAIGAVRGEVRSVWNAFNWSGEGDPYVIPERAVETAVGSADGE